MPGIQGAIKSNIVLENNQTAVRPPTIFKKEVIDSSLYTKKLKIDSSDITKKIINGEIHEPNIKIYNSLLNYIKKIKK